MRALVVAALLLAGPAAAQEDFSELFPVETDVKKKVVTPAGAEIATTGPNSCRWFIQDGAPEWKIFKPKKGALVVLLFWGERGPNAPSDLQLRLLLKEGKLWQKMVDLPGPSLEEVKDDPGYRIYAFFSDGRPLMVKGYGNGCYLRVFQIGNVCEAVRLQKEKAKKVDGLLSVLWGDEWRARRRAAKALVQLARKDAAVVRYLQDVLRKNPQPWRKIPLLRVLWLLERGVDERMAVAGVSDLKAKAERLLMWALGRVRGAEDEAESARRAIEWLVPLDVERAMKLLEHRYPEARLAAMLGLARTEADLKAALKAYRDRCRQIRLEAVRILARHPTDNEAREALHELAEDDPEPRVRLAAEDALDTERDGED